jgi:hypothetical protein
MTLIALQYAEEGLMPVGTFFKQRRAVKEANKKPWED